MSQIELALNQARAEVFNMWTMVQSQIENAYFAMHNFDKDLAREIKSKEKRVNGIEIKIDRDCEHLLALYAPVAVDLRLVLAMLKINTNLERIGDVADSIAHYILCTDEAFSTALLKDSGVLEMFVLALSVLESSRRAFETEDSRLARRVFQQDEALNQINVQAIPFTLEFMKSNQEEAGRALTVLSVIRKLERVGDHAKNIAEETIFYLEAKVLKHRELDY